MLTHTGTKPIKTNRLTLRRFGIDDAQAMFENWANDEATARFMSWKPHGTPEETRQTLEKWCAEYEKKNYYHWVIEYENDIIGSIGANSLSERGCHCALGYCIGIRWWGRGIMTEAAAGVIDYLFANVGFNRIAISHATNNPASGRVAQKCGFTFEGISRQKSLLADGSFHDSATYSILRAEWLERRMLTLSHGRVVLRPFEEGDADAVHSYASSHENVRYMVWGPNTREETDEFIKSCIKKWGASPIREYEFAITLADGGRLIGGCGIYLNRERTEAMLGWILHRDLWRQGYAAEAARAMLRYCFEELGLHRVYATCNVENYGSYRVMEKIGMRREAHFIKNRFGRVEDAEMWYDEYHYAILEEEWRALHETGLS